MLTYGDQCCRLLRYLPHNLQALLPQNSHYLRISSPNIPKLMSGSSSLNRECSSRAFQKGFKGLIQQIVVADYYFQHLDGRLPVIVLNSLMSSDATQNTHEARQAPLGAVADVVSPRQQPTPSVEEEVDEVAQMLELLCVRWVATGQEPSDLYIKKQDILVACCQGCPLTRGYYIHRKTS
jgi:hypothetical protein